MIILSLSALFINIEKIFFSTLKIRKASEIEALRI